MTTKEFIKMLTEADPTGEGHVRLYGGVPRFAESKPGYWDGAYQYIDEEGNFVTSIKGYKVDITCIEIEDFVSNLVNMHNPQNWEEIEKKIKFEFGGYSNTEQRNDKERVIIEKARSFWEEIMNMEITSYKRALEEMRSNSDKGWTWFQNKLVDTQKGAHIYYTWKVYNENNKEMGSNVWNTETVQKTGEWEKLDNNVKEGYYQWVHKSKIEFVPAEPIPLKNTALQTLIERSIGGEFKFDMLNSNIKQKIVIKENLFQKLKRWLLVRKGK